MGNCSACAHIEGASLDDFGMVRFGIAVRGSCNIVFFPHVGAAIFSTKGHLDGAKSGPAAACDCNHSTAVHVDDRLPVAYPSVKRGAIHGLFLMRHRTLTREEL